MKIRPIGINYTSEDDRLRVWFLDVEQNFPKAHPLSLEGPVGEFRDRETGELCGWEIFDFVRFAERNFFWIPTDEPEPGGFFQFEDWPGMSFSETLKCYYEERILQHAA